MTSSSPTRARSATVVIVGPPPRLEEAAAVLGGDEAGSLRVVLISTAATAVSVAGQPDIVSIGGLRPEHVNNAIGGVRLSSLPTVVWWRGGVAEGLDGVARLADRVVLDAEDPWPLWTRTPSLFEATAFTDLRWTRLTRWRSAMAHFFDLPQVIEMAALFSSLTIRGSDEAQCALFVGWLDGSLGWKGRVRTQFLSGAAPMESVVLSGSGGELALQRLPNQTCLDTQARLPTHVLASRVISLGDQQLRTLMAEELRVRSRDLPFERALEAALRHRAPGQQAPGTRLPGPGT